MHRNLNSSSFCLFLLSTSLLSTFSFLPTSYFRLCLCVFALMLFYPLFSGREIPEETRARPRARVGESKLGRTPLSVCFGQAAVTVGRSNSSKVKLRAQVPECPNAQSPELPELLGAKPRRGKRDTHTTASATALPPDHRPIALEGEMRGNGERSKRDVFHPSTRPPPPHTLTDANPISFPPPSKEGSARQRGVGALGRLDAWTPALPACLACFTRLLPCQSDCLSVSPVSRSYSL